MDTIIVAQMTVCEHEFILDGIELKYGGWVPVKICDKCGLMMFDGGYNKRDEEKLITMDKEGIENDTRD